MLCKVCLIQKRLKYKCDNTCGSAELQYDLCSLHWPITKSHKCRCRDSTQEAIKVLRSKCKYSRSIWNIIKKSGETNKLNLKKITFNNQSNSSYNFVLASSFNSRKKTKGIRQLNYIHQRLSKQNSHSYHATELQCIELVLILNFSSFETVVHIFFTFLSGVFTSTLVACKACEQRAEQ